MIPRATEGLSLDYYLEEKVRKQMAIKPGSPALQADSSSSEPPEKSIGTHTYVINL